MTFITLLFILLIKRWLPWQPGGMGYGWAAWWPPAPGGVCSCVPEPAWVRPLRLGTWGRSGGRLVADSDHSSLELD